MKTPHLIAVMGTTASGKTDLAEALADRLDAQLINCDAFQVYRCLDIGTAKSERKAEYRLVDIKNPDEQFGVGEWVRLASEILRDLFAEGRSAVVVGGTGLAVRALFEQYGDMASAPDPELRQELGQLSLEELKSRLAELDSTALETVDLQNRVRVQRAVERRLSPAAPAVALPPFRKIKFGLERDPEETNRRIASRAGQMVEDGWLEEVRNLRDLGYSPENPGMRAHGYRHIWQVLEGKMEMAQALDLTIGEVRRYAKRQRTWNRKEPGLIRINSDNPLDEAMRHL